MCNLLLTVLCQLDGMTSHDMYIDLPSADHAVLWFRADVGAALWARRLVCSRDQSYGLQHCLCISRWVAIPSLELVQLSSAYACWPWTHTQLIMSKTTASCLDKLAGGQSVGLLHKQQV